MMMFSLVGKEKRTLHLLGFLLFGGVFFGPLLCRVFMVTCSRTPTVPSRRSNHQTAVCPSVFEIRTSFPLAGIHIIIWISTLLSQISLFFLHCLLSDGQCWLAFLLADFVFSLLFPHLDIQKSKYGFEQK